MEVKKTCHSCGADVTHTIRHKNRNGEYVCSKCLEARRQSSQQQDRQYVRTRFRRIFLCAFLAAAAGWIFFKLLGVMDQLSDSDD